jgi:hypothetical protein
MRPPLLVELYINMRCRYCHNEIIEGDVLFHLKYRKNGETFTDHFFCKKSPLKAKTLGGSYKTRSYRNFRIHQPQTEIDLVNQIIGKYLV